MLSSSAAGSRRGARGEKLGAWARRLARTRVGTRARRRIQHIRLPRVTSRGAWGCRGRTRTESVSALSSHQGRQGGDDDADASDHHSALAQFLTKYGITAAISILLVGWAPSGGVPSLQCFLASWSSVALLCRFAVPRMKSLKQSFQENGPRHFGKVGTPTAGGALFIPIGLAIGLLHAMPLTVSSAQRALILGVTLCTLSCSLIGLADDWLIITRESNRGISPRTKLALQMVTSLAFCLLSVSGNLKAVFSVFPLRLFALSVVAKWVYYTVALFVISGESNAVNLTDGIDGLAGGLFAIASVGMAAAVARAPFGSPGLGLLCISMAGACCGFLTHNGHPAKIFMGDTGSLALGAFLSSVAIGTGSIVPFLFLTAPFNFEMASVMAQVGYFKWTRARTGEGRRLLKMAPFHHHLEESKWSERSIVLAFYVVAACLFACNLGHLVRPV